MAEWPELDYEARRFTAKILGEDFEPQGQAAPPAETQKTISDAPLVDEESKSELWIWCKANISGALTPYPIGIICSHFLVHLSYHGKKALEQSLLRWAIEAESRCTF